MPITNLGYQVACDKCKAKYVYRGVLTSQQHAINWAKHAGWSVLRDKARVKGEPNTDRKWRTWCPICAFRRAGGVVHNSSHEKAISDSRAKVLARAQALDAVLGGRVKQ